MTYHSMSECTLSPEERRAEATKIVEMIVNSDISICNWLESEITFYTNMCNPALAVSVRQLFWLRDIKDKYL